MAGYVRAPAVRSPGARFASATTDPTRQAPKMLLAGVVGIAVIMFASLAIWTIVKSQPSPQEAAAVEIESYVAALCRTNAACDSSTVVVDPHSCRSTSDPEYDNLMDCRVALAILNRPCTAPMRATIEADGDYRIWRTGTHECADDVG